MLTRKPVLVPLAWLQVACLLLQNVGARAQPASETADRHSVPRASGGDTLEPTPAPEAPRRQRKVFVCRESGVPEFTDRPCSPSPAILEIDFAAPGAGRSASVAPPPPAASTRPRIVQAPAQDAEVAQRSARCTTLRERLAGIDRQMRAGYSAREAARLWQRWRETRAQLREQRC